MGKRILVTGGAGYIGSHTCKGLAKSGFEPVVYDNLKYGHKEFVKWGPLIQGDIKDQEKLKQVLTEQKISAVIHFAAYAYVGESVEKPTLYYDNNVAGTLSLLQAMQASSVERLIFSSTCATYGVPEKTPISEETPQNPINPYGRSKLMIEQILKDAAPAAYLHSVSLRYFNAAGASLEGDIGESHDPETHLIPLALRAADLGEPLTVFGNDYPTADGTCVRDYIHVEDLAAAHVLALRFLLDNKSTPQAWQFNLGNGQGFSVKEVLACVEKVTGKTLKIQMGQRRAGDPAQLIASADKAQTTLGWQPRITELEKIIQSAWLWHQKSSNVKT